MQNEPQQETSGMSEAVRLVNRVQLRMRLTAFSRSVYLWLLVAGLMFAFGVLLSRLTGYGGEWFTVRMAMVIPALSLLGGWLTFRRPEQGEAARVVDRFGNTKDLFLALSYLESAAGGYQPLVARTAEQAARSIRPQLVVPWEAWRPTRNLLLLSVCLGAGLLWLPQFDPFGQIQASNQVVQEKKQLAESRRLTTMRSETLQKSEKENPATKESSKAIEELKKLLKLAKPQESKKNQEELASVQKGLNQEWKKMDAGKLREMLKEGLIGQEFGEATGRQKEWMKELREGNLDELKKELEEIKKLAEELKETKDPIKKQELEKKLKKKLRDMQQFAEKKTGKKELANALERAMNQLQMATKGEKIDPEAMEALKDSLELSEKELEQLAKDVKDLKNVENAMQLAQMAQQLNRAGKLDGEKCENCEGLSDYEELLKELMGEMSEGEGMGDQGQGRGDKAPENDELASKFKDENSKSPVKAGKMLMSLSTKGEGEKGESKQEYQDLVRTLQQGVTEAIQKEDIPPGYQENIKKYFEELDEEPVVKEGSAEKK
jgi:hypothetical protein